MPTRFTNLEALVPFARRRALRGLYDGRMTEANMALMRACSHIWAYGLESYSRIIYTRDTGHHTGGWWKNPDYERCLHLSVSYADVLTGAVVEHDHDRTLAMARAFFGDDLRLAWLEPPYSEEGKANNVWHYRLFCDEGWQPLKPRGEVYSRDWTPANWKSFSEVHGLGPDQVDAPFLTAASD